MERKKFNWSYLLLGIFFILIGFFSFRDPAGNLLALTMFFAFLAILKGGFELFIRRQIKEYIGVKSTSLIVIGLIDLILGIFLFFNLNAGLIALPYIFAAWFIIDSIGELMVAGAYKTISNGYYWFNVIINILGVILGFMLLFNPITSAITLAFLVGIYFMISGITYVIAAF